MSIAASAGLCGVGEDEDRRDRYSWIQMFVHEAKMVLPVVDAAIVVVDGVAGVEVVTRGSGTIAKSTKYPG